MTEELDKVPRTSRAMELVKTAFNESLMAALDTRAMEKAREKLLSQIEKMKGQTEGYEENLVRAKLFVSWHRDRDAALNSGQFNINRRGEISFVDPRFNKSAESWVYPEAEKQIQGTDGQ